jgi:hypothetical protein
VLSASGLPLTEALRKQFRRALVVDASKHIRSKHGSNFGWGVWELLPIQLTPPSSMGSGRIGAVTSNSQRFPLASGAI